MQQLQGREFSIEQEVSLQFTESSWNGFMRILFQIPAELKKQLPIDPRTSDPRTTLQKILESDIWAIKEGNNLLLLSRCFVLPCTLVRIDSDSLLRVHSCRQTSDGDAVTAFNEGVLIKASWSILLPEDSFVSTTAAESLYSFFFPEESVPEIRPKNERTAQPAAYSVVPPVAQPAAVQPAVVQPTTVQPAVVQPAVVQPAAVQPAAVQPAVPSVADTVIEKPIVQQPQPWSEIVKAAPMTSAAPVMMTPMADLTDNMHVVADANDPQPAVNPAGWNSGATQVSGKPVEKLNFNLSGGELSGSVSETEQSESLFSLDQKSAKSIPVKEVSEPGIVSEDNGDKSTDKNAEKGTVTIKYSEGYTVEGSPHFMNEFLKKPGSTTSEVTSISAGSDSTNDIDKINAPAASNVPSFDNNRVYGASSSMAPLKQGTIDEIIAKMNALNNVGSDMIQRNVVPPVQQNVAPVQPPQPQRPQPFISQPVNRTMADHPAASPVSPINPVSQPGLGTQAFGQQVQPFHSNRMGMAMAQPIEAVKPGAPKMAGSTKDEGEPLMSQNQIDALIANLKGGQ